MSALVLAAGAALVLALWVFWLQLKLRNARARELRAYGRGRMDGGAGVLGFKRPWPDEMKPEPLAPWWAR